MWAGRGAITLIRAAPATSNHTLYSFSFAPNPDWSSSFSAQPEIWAYLQRCARDFGVLPHIRFHHEVREACWDEAAQHWRIETSQGSYTASILVMASGPLSEPAMPQLPD